MRQVKAYVELHPFDELTGFAEAERVVSSYYLTPALSTLVAQIISELAAPRPVTNDFGSAALQVITGPRGAGKSHLLAFLRAVIGTKPLRSLVHNSAILSALNLLNDRAPFAVEVNFAGSEDEPFEARLRAAFDQALGQNFKFDDEQWARAVAGEQVFEQALSLLPLNAQLILFIDNLSGRWRQRPQLAERDLDWLALIARQSAALPLRAIITRDEAGEATSTQPAVYPLSPAILKEVIARRVLVKTPQQVDDLAEVRRELQAHLPGFAWRLEEFVASYPVHPVVFELAPVLRTAGQSFSLAGFVTSVAGRALNHPALSLITLDEVFDRYEYEFRKNAALGATFARYDRLTAEVISKLPFNERLWAKLVVKSLLLLSLTGQPVTARQIAEAQLLYESDDTQAGEARITQLLDRLIADCPEAILCEGGDEQRSYLLAAPEEAVDLEAELAEAALEIAADDARLAALLVKVGGQLFDGWRPGGEVPVHPASHTIIWRGTPRTGSLQFSQPQLSTALSWPEWRLLITPFNRRAESEAAGEGLSVLWLPGELSDVSELESLKKLLALHERAARQPAISPKEAAEIAGWELALTTSVQQLFTRLYLEHGTWRDQQGARPIPQEAWRGTETGRFQPLATFVSAALAPAFDQCFPYHPHFADALTEEQVKSLVTGLFTQSVAEPQAADLQDLAARFAAPLGLVSRHSEGADPAPYQLDVFHHSAHSKPFIQALFAFVDERTEESGVATVPLQEVGQLLGGPPHGLLPAAQNLMLGAFVASGLIELVHEATGEQLHLNNLPAGFEPERYTALRQVTASSYPAEMLIVWARQLTGQQQLPVPSTPKEEQQVRQALGFWLAGWQEKRLAAGFDHLPHELLTLGSWRTLMITKEKFLRVAALVEATVNEKLSLPTALSRVADVFAFDYDALTKAQQNLLALSGFLDWVPTFMRIRHFLLAAEPTGDAEIERLRLELRTQLEPVKAFVTTEARQRLETTFAEFLKRYGDFYVAAHESHVGLAAYRELLASFCSGPEWTSFQLLLHLKLDGQVFGRDARDLLKLAQDTTCEYPVRDLLQLQPHCCCAFRLQHRLHLGSILDALKEVVGAATAFYRQSLWERREELSLRVSRVYEHPIAAAVDEFLEQCRDGEINRLSPELVSVLNQCLPDEAGTASAELLPPLLHYLHRGH